jgi:hypothetical protein
MKFQIKKMSNNIKHVKNETYKKRGIATKQITPNIPNKHNSKKNLFLGL